LSSNLQQGGKSTVSPALPLGRKQKTLFCLFQLIFNLRLGLLVSFRRNGFVVHILELAISAFVIVQPDA